ncbi:MAG: succinyl-diaminopimelate desuccinylase [Sphingomonadales bacterium]|jgi:succinyl-diaminopimelate desuccinylase
MQTSFDPLDIAVALMRCPSITPKDAGALDVLQKHLEELGFHCTRLPFGEGEERVDNLYARLGTSAPNFCFAGHTDVVPPGDIAEWSHDPFDAKVEDGWLIGRGAADMKGAVAAFVAACAKYGAPSTGSISLLITGDEEGVADYGTVKVLDWLREQGEQIDHCLVGEPTSAFTLGDIIKNGRRGSLNAWLTVNGTQGHVAYPHRADNPIPRLIKFLDDVTARHLDDGNEDFDPSNLEVTDIEVGNEATNIIPAQAKARLNIRFNTEHRGRELEAWLHEVAQAQAGNHDLKVRISGEAFITKAGPFSALIQDAIQDVVHVDAKLSTSGGTSDARFITHMCDVVEFGLVGTSMHKVDERVKARDVVALAKIYEGVLARYFTP